jgi:NAD(P)-dependent dehydrogenase (short-subunit alcohol dehydrogenase family)
MNATDDFPVPDYANLLRLDDRVFLVAGGGYGMGRQAAHALAAVGARVACIDVDGERAAAVADQVGGISLEADITNREEVERAVSGTEEALGPLSGLIDVVGISGWSPALDIDDDMWDRQFGVNLRHAYLLGQTVGRRLVANGGGTLVFIASISGITAAPGHAAYGAAKAALMSWVRSLAVELGPHGVRVNAVAPGATRTPRSDDPSKRDMQAVTASITPLRRMGSPDDMARAALFFSTPLSAYVTGRTLVVDGGVDVKFPYTDLTAGNTAR